MLAFARAAGVPRLGRTRSQLHAHQCALMGPARKGVIARVFSQVYTCFTSAYFGTQVEPGWATDICILLESSNRMEVFAQQDPFQLDPTRLLLNLIALRSIRFA